jgi:hypothetical protein
MPILGRVENGGGRFRPPPHSDLLLLLNSVLKGALEAPLAPPFRAGPPGVSPPGSR